MDITIHIKHQSELQVSGYFSPKSVQADEHAWIQLHVKNLYSEGDIHICVNRDALKEFKQQINEIINKIGNEIILFDEEQKQITLS